MNQLSPAFERVAEIMRQNREELNRADPYNGNHGDHMVEIFELAASAVGGLGDAPLPDAMEYAGVRLTELPGNGSAGVYAAGLAQFAAQFRERNVTASDLELYIERGLTGDREEHTSVEGDPANGGELLKALLSGLAGWRAVVDGKQPPQESLDTAYLFDLGVAYMQAKARGGGKTAVIADAAVSVSPLNAVPHRAQSCRLAIQSLLEFWGIVGR